MYKCWVITSIDYRNLIIKINYNGVKQHANYIDVTVFLYPQLYTLIRVLKTIFYESHIISFEFQIFNKAPINCVFYIE